MTHSLHREIHGHGQPLVLLHGWGWDSRIWYPLLPELGKKFQLFLLDLPGCGKSTYLPQPYDIETITTLLLEAAPPTAIWLGWSLGGMLAWYIALHHPARVSHLITVASSAKFVKGPNWPGVELATLQKFSALLEKNYVTTLQEFLTLQLRGAPKNTALLTELNQQIATYSCYSLAGLTGGLTLLQELDLRPDLIKIQCPSLHLFGSHDTLVPASIVPLLQQSLPKKSRCEIIARGGHILFLSQTEIFLQQLSQFLL